MLLEEKNAIVTGGSQGIGEAVSLELAREGANICLLYRKHESEAYRIRDEIISMGRNALALKADASSFEDAENIVNQTLNYLFGNLGVGPSISNEQLDGMSPQQAAF